MTPGGDSYDERVRVQHEPDPKPLVVLVRRWVWRDPVLAGVAMLGGLLVAAVDSLVLGWTLTHGGVLRETTTVDGVVAAATRAVATVCAAVVLAAACALADGHRDLTGRAAWSLLRGRWLAVVTWAALSGSVLLVLDLVLAPLGLLSGPLILLGHLAWWTVTLYALPAIVLTGALPHRALGHSLDLLLATFSFTAGANVRALWPWIPVALGGAILLGLGGVAHVHYAESVPSWGAAGVLVMVLGYLVLDCALAFQSAVTGVVNLAVLRHDRGRRTPGLTPFQLPTRWRPRDLAP